MLSPRLFVAQKASLHLLVLSPMPLEKSIIPPIQHPVWCGVLRILSGKPSASHINQTSTFHSPLTARIRLSRPHLNSLHEHLYLSSAQPGPLDSVIRRSACKKRTCRWSPFIWSTQPRVLVARHETILSTIRKPLPQLLIRKGHLQPRTRTRAFTLGVRGQTRMASRSRPWFTLRVGCSSTHSVPMLIHQISLVGVC